MPLRKIKDVNHWDKIKHEMNELDGAVVKAGITERVGSTRPNGSSATLAEYATYNELGTPKIPARPFISTTADEKRTAWNQLIDKTMNAVLDRRMKAIDAMEKVGQQAAGDIKRKIASIYTPKNADSTVARKNRKNKKPKTPLTGGRPGKQYRADKPLVDTGTMFQSIDYEVKR